MGECRHGHLRFVGEVYDSRAYGGKPGTALTSNDVNVLEPVQAYVALDIPDPFGAKSKAAITAGRMMLNIGSRRLVAADDYRNTTTSYTGLRADVALSQGFTATAIVVAPQFRLPGDAASVHDNRQALDLETDDLLLFGGVASAPLSIGGGRIEGSYFGLRERDAPDRPTRDRRLETFGLRLYRDPAPARFDYDVEVIGQTGHVSDSLAVNAQRLDVAAGFVHAEAGHQWADPWKTRLSAEFDWASGDDAGPKYRRFDTLFGMRRAEFAPSGILAAIGRANIAMPGVRVEIAPGERLDAFASIHRLYLASATDSFTNTGVRDASGNAGRHGGDLFDCRVRYWLVPNALRLEVDYTFIAKGRFLRDAPNAPAGGDTQYLSLNATWTF
jgi:hypothetical protein